MRLKPLHQGISVTDMDRSLKWYSEVLGFELVSRQFEPDLGAVVAFLRRDDFEIELFEYKGSGRHDLPDDRKVPDEDLKYIGTKHVAYAVENMWEAVSKLKEKGVHMATPILNMHGQLVCFVNDPDGILIELIQPQKI